MLTEYECVVNKGHKMSCGEPQTPTPQCCGQPMVVTMTSGAPAAAAEPAVVPAGAAPKSTWKGGKTPVTAG